LQAYTGNRKTANVIDFLWLNQHCKQNISDKSEQLKAAAAAAES
jgi:hypothetical protein